MKNLLMKMLMRLACSHGRYEYSGPGWVRCVGCGKSKRG